jgi:cell division protein FtsL
LILGDFKMVETQKNVIGRNVAIALGIICIVLAVGLVGAIAVYTSQINDKNNTIATKDSQITSLNSEITDKDNTISSLNSQISSLNSEKSNLTEIINLANSTVWVNDQTISQSASSYTFWGGPHLYMTPTLYMTPAYWGPAFSTSYAGYVSVDVLSSNTTNTYVEVIWSAYGVSYDNTITVGTSGTAVFPVLPCSSIEIRVGNTNLSNGANETVTITYYY